MLAKFQYIMFQDTVLKAVCLGTLTEKELEKDKKYYTTKKYIEKSENYLFHKGLHVAIIYEDIKNLQHSQYNYLGLKSTYERFVKRYERY